MAFKPSGSLNPYGGPVLRSLILADGITVTEQDALEPSSGFAALGTSGNGLLGHVTAIVTDDGVGMETTGVAGAATGTFVGTFLTAGDNTTVNKFRAMVDISKETLYSAELNAAIGTNDSDLLGNYMDLADEDTLDESTATTTQFQYFVWGVDPADSTKSLVNLFESSVFGPF